MIEQQSIEDYNTRLTVDYSNIRNLTASQRDRVINYGSQAQNLLTNRDLAMFIHHYKFDVCDRLSMISGHTPEHNLQRVALANELSGIDSFINTLKRAVLMKNRVGNITDNAQQTNQESN